MNGEKEGKDKCLRIQAVLDCFWMPDLSKKCLLVDMLTVAFLSALDLEQVPNSKYFLIESIDAIYSRHRVYAWLASRQYRSPIFPHRCAWLHKSSLAHLWDSARAAEWELQQELSSALRLTDGGTSWQSRLVQEAANTLNSPSLMAGHYYWFILSTDELCQRLVVPILFCLTFQFLLGYMK